MIYITNSDKETYDLAADIAARVKPGQVLALKGDLGSGKTTFTKGFASELGIKRHITSPTFLLIKTYEVEREGIHKLYHLDLYRLRDEKEIEGIGVSEILKDPHGVVIIEWAERMGNLLPKDRIEIEFEYLEENKRKITINED
jgi:tRNA threonylcarbamoyladenosine biosynthesis protein TsaE